MFLEKTCKTQSKPPKLRALFADGGRKPTVQLALCDSRCASILTSAILSCQHLSDHALAIPDAARGAHELLREQYGDDGEDDHREDHDIHLRQFLAEPDGAENP